MAYVCFFASINNAAYFLGSLFQGIYIFISLGTGIFYQLRSPALLILADSVRLSVSILIPTFSKGRAQYEFY